MNTKELLGMLTDRIAELEKERDEWKLAADCEANAVTELRNRIAELTCPREVDEALVEDMAKILFAKTVFGFGTWDGCGGRLRDNQRAIVRAILAALPPLVQPPVVLTDDECDRLATVYEDATDEAEDAEGQADRAGVRALLAAAGRYVAPAGSAGPATEWDMKVAWF